MVRLPHLTEQNEGDCSVDILKAFAQRCFLDALISVSKESTYKVLFLKYQQSKTGKQFFFFFQSFQLAFIKNCHVLS